MNRFFKKTLSLFLALTLIGATLGANFTLTTFGLDNKVFAETTFTAVDATIQTQINTPKAGVLSSVGATGTVTYTIEEPYPEKGSVAVSNATTGAFTYTPFEDQVGTDTFKFKAATTINATLVEVTGTITVEIEDTRYRAEDKTIAVLKNSPYHGTLSTLYAEGAVTYAITLEPEKGTVTLTNPTTGAFTYTPNADETGIDEFQFSATDQTPETVTGTITVSITTPNLAARDLTLNTEKNKPVDGTLSVSSANGPVTFAIITESAHGTTNLTDATAGTFTYTPEDDFIGTDTFTFRVTDQTPSVSTGVVTINVTEIPLPFTYEDLVDHWGEEAALELLKEEVVRGDRIFRQNYFYPEQPMRRIDFILWMLAAVNIDISEKTAPTSPFADAAEYPAWVGKAATIAYDEKIISGVKEGTKIYIKPYDVIKRDEAITIFNNIVKEHDNTNDETNNENENIESAMYSNINTTGISNNTNVIPNTPAGMTRITNKRLHVAQKNRLPLNTISKTHATTDNNTTLAGNIRITANNSTMNNTAGNTRTTTNNTQRGVSTYGATSFGGNDELLFAGETDDTNGTDNNNNTNTPTPGRKITEFKDYLTVPAWAKPAFENLLEKGLVQGDGHNLMPLLPINRAMASQLIYNVMEWQRSQEPEPENEDEIENDGTSNLSIISTTELDGNLVDGGNVNTNGTRTNTTNSFYSNPYFRITQNGASLNRPATTNGATNTTSGGTTGTTTRNGVQTTNTGINSSTTTNNTNRNTVINGATNATPSGATTTTNGVTGR